MALASQVQARNNFNKAAEHLKEEIFSALRLGNIFEFKERMKLWNDEKVQRAVEQSGIKLADKRGFSPAHYAALHGHRETMIAVKEAGISLQDRVDGIGTPADVARSLCYENFAVQIEIWAEQEKVAEEAAKVIERFDYSAQSKSDIARSAQTINNEALEVLLPKAA
ncbi:MAG: hypothetical protein R3E13_05125 [Alphaproteobacteria bacterium]